MTMTDPTIDPTLAAIPPRLATWPDPKLLPAKVRPIVAEYERTYATLDTLVENYVRLTSAEALRQAAETDALAQAGAIRQGQTASSIGRPAAEALEAETLAAETELVGALTALRIITAELQITFGEVWTEDRASGRADAFAAVAAYRDAITAVSTARAQAVQALTLPTFVELIGCRYAPGSTDGPTVQFRPPNLNYGANAVRIMPEDHIDPKVYDQLLNRMADAITDAIPNP